MKKIFYILVFGALALCAALNLAADKFIFHPKKDYEQHLRGFEEVAFASADGTLIHGLYIAPAEFMDTILFFHGNAGNVTYFEEFGDAYAKRGYGFLVFDYRGFGRSEGEITESNIYADSRAAVEFLIKEKKTAPANIVLFGYSLGCAAAVQTALNFKGTDFRALILQSPFTNVPQMGAALIGGAYAPGSAAQKITIGVLYAALFNKRFDNLAKIGKINLPMLIGYSRQDALIPWQMSEALACAAPEGTKSYLSPRGKHNEHLWFEKPVVDFLNSPR